MLDRIRGVMIHNWKKFLLPNYCIDHDSNSTIFQLTVSSLDDKQKAHFLTVSSFMIPLFLSSPSDTESHSAYLIGWRASIWILGLLGCAIMKETGSLGSALEWGPFKAHNTFFPLVLIRLLF